MSSQASFALLAEYNEWMNAKVYEAAARLSPQELAAGRGAFFGSLLGTLNHLVVADTTWLKRFAQHPAQHPELDAVRTLPAPTALNQQLFAELPALWERRRLLDATIRRWIAVLSEEDLAHVLDYRNMQGQPFRRQLSLLLLHFFNHQTHHRGQASTLLTQAGQDVGVTDLIAMLPAQLGT